MTYQDKIGEFLSRIDEIARAGAEYGAVEKLTPWVRQAMVEYPIISTFILQDPRAILGWVRILAPAAATRYLPDPEAERRAGTVIAAVQERLR